VLNDDDDDISIDGTAEVWDAAVAAGDVVAIAIAPTVFLFVCAANCERRRERTRGGVLEGNDRIMIVKVVLML